MNVGRATLNDLPAILEFSREAFAGSVTYQATGYNEAIWSNTLRGVFRDHVANAVFVARRAGKVCGLLVGMKLPMPWSAGFCATDLVFVAHAGGDRLLRLFLQWCRQHRVRRVDMSVSDTSIPAEQIDNLYTRAGFSRAGGSYHRIEVYP